MKKKSFIIGGIIVTIVAVIAAVKPFSRNEEEVFFETVRVEKGAIANTVTATGTIEAIKTVKVGTQVSGIIQHVYVDFNNNVRQGQLLAKLDETPLRAQLEQSQASVDQALAQLNFHDATYRRLKVLYEKDLIAQSDYDQALFNFENSKAALSNARSALARAKVNLDYATITSPIDGVVLNRAVEEGQTVAASFNTPELFTIVNDLTRMKVKTSVDEADIGKVKQGQRIEFTVDAYPDKKFDGTVSEVRLQPVTTNNVVTYDVILSAPNPEKRLMPGMTASTTIYVDEKADALILSGKALRFTPDREYLKKLREDMMKNAPTGSGTETAVVLPTPGMIPQRVQADALTGQGMNSVMPQMSEAMKMVWVKDEKAGVRPIPVETGIDNATYVEILSGLKEGDEVIISMTGGSKKAATKGEEGPRGPFPGFGPQGG